ncbi:phage baseplate assembly protein V [Altericroceibacterium endophyticum]|uniref:Phage baseplate assembly protein V n=1 Tax=Altericroceibacterium endophyticum TaxID=1808508 RepID=A0A6I4T3K8_9SPHN|nr:phage baseplate assembly protein V [Altericroceibacterium endophyticum]MXO64859.1 phage baseplate assembly protein V [Altericroceibacterium endophyticum]
MSIPRSTGHTGDPSQLIRIGRIIAVDRASARCQVEIGDPDRQSVTTIFIRWGVLRAGETIIWSPPSEGEQVLLFCPDGDIAQAVPFGALYSADYPAPATDTREFIRFADGAEIGYDADNHHLDLTLPPDATTRIESDGGVTIIGDVRVEGDVFADGISLKQHRHLGVQPGAGISGMPQE